MKETSVCHVSDLESATLNKNFDTSSSTHKPLLHLFFVHFVVFMMSSSIFERAKEQKQRWLQRRRERERAHCALETTAE